MLRKKPIALRTLLRRVFQPSDELVGADSESQLPARIVRRLDTLGERLSAWVAARQYCHPSPNLDETVRQLGTDKKLLYAYFRLRVGEDFRTWRTRLRLQEAQRLLRENPDLSASEVSRRTGFNDRSNFSKQFFAHMGMSVTQWRRQEKIEKKFAD